MITLEHSLTSGVGADRAWKLVGNLAGLTQWVPGVTDVVLDGDVRICTFADGRVQRETIESVDGEGRAYRYSTDVAGTPMTSNRGEFSVVERRSGGCVVRWSADIDFADEQAADMMIPMLREGYSAAFANLAEQLER